MLALLLCCALAIGAFSSAALAAEETIVKSYDDLSYAIANGGNIKLGADIEISSESASFGITNEVTLDLAGYALTRPALRAQSCLTSAAAASSRSMIPALRAALKAVTRCS